MDPTTKRLVACFTHVFPELSEEEAVRASATSVAKWDSLASITLLTLISEEFGVNLDVEDLGETPSFQTLLSRVRDAQEVAS